MSHRRMHPRDKPDALDLGDPEEEDERRHDAADPPDDTDDAHEHRRGDRPATEGAGGS